MSNAAARLIASATIIAGGAICLGISGTGPRYQYGDGVSVGWWMIGVGGMLFLIDWLGLRSPKE